MQQFFNQESGRDLKPLFDLYLRSVNKLEVHIKALRNDKYLVQLQNMTMPLPMDITTDDGTKKMIIDSKGLTIQSKMLPVIDPDMYYLKKIIVE